jgi:hypothetical protein
MRRRRKRGRGRGGEERGERGGG